VTTRVDLALQKYSGHETGIRLLAERDPSGNQKYLDWGAKMLAAGQALAPEIADVLDLYHRFRGQPYVHGRVRRFADRVHPDVYTYRPQDFASLRDHLIKLKRVQDRKAKKRERLYRIEGAVEADVVHDSSDLLVRHVKNKQASVHYGLGTKWCIAMLREGYFEDYDAQNATFFFFERKAKRGDDFDKVCLMVPRGSWAPGEDDFIAFTATDQRVGLMRLAHVYGPDFFGVLQRVHAVSERYPGSAIAQVYAGTASAEQLATVFALLGRGEFTRVHAVDATLEAIACNDAAPWSLLEEVARRARALVAAAMRRSKLRIHYHRRGRAGSTPEIVRVIEAALVVHPATPADARERLARQLRRRKIGVEDVRRVDREGRVGVQYDPPVRDGRWRAHYRRRLRRSTPKQLRAWADSLERRAARARKSAEKLEVAKMEKLAKAKKKCAAAAKRRS
jgi:hypothetical protein